MKLVYALFILSGTFTLSEQSILEDMEPGTALSRFDYDYEMLKKMVDLETQLANLQKRFDEFEAKKGVDMTTDCPDGWLAYKGSCYLFGPNSLAFEAAKEYCIRNAVYLVRVENAREDVFLKTFMDQHLNDADYWLGINDDETEGVWKFTDDGTGDGTDDGSEVPYLGWGGTEPQDAGKGEDCAAFGQSLQYKWKDVPCSSLRRPLCEKRQPTS
ncbi:perlucin-like protein [Mercenaria mercenaria]|uniref:perlucin-like protein n=1 Tax=Mercenaria mercenaria TaxID=6596 RepID=UPI00234E7A32|nr:perlucin-like protein [Mercenaria mercenaria]